MSTLGTERKETPERHSVIFAMVKNGLFELEERRELDRWFGLTIFPGGHIEEGETQEEAAIREIGEEYGRDVVVLKLKKLGTIPDVDRNSVLHYKHVFLITDWFGSLANPEGRNKHIQATFAEARRLCTHPISQKVLDMVEQDLFWQNG